MPQHFRSKATEILSGAVVVTRLQSVGRRPYSAANEGENSVRIRSFKSCLDLDLVRKSWVLLLEGALAQVGLVGNRREVSAALARRLGVFRGLDRGGLQQRGMVGFHSGRVLESSTGRVYDSGVLRA